MHEGRRKSLPCGAGIGLLAVDGDGELNLCHRFTGSDLPTFGNVATGIDGERLSAFIDKAVDREGTHCESAASAISAPAAATMNRMRDSAMPIIEPTITASLLRSWVDFGVRVYADIQRQNPGFFSRHLEPRSAIA